MRILRRSPGLLLLLVAGGACGESARPPILDKDGSILPLLDTGVVPPVDAGTDARVDVVTASDTGTDVTIAMDTGTDVPATDTGTDVPATDTGTDVPVVDTGADVPPADAGCTGTRRICTGVCVDTATDRANCGSCGRACDPGQTCVSSACVMACTPEQRNCAGTCRSVATDAANCGACGASCPTGVTCVGGVCQTSFAPTVNPTYLASGTYSFTSVRIPAGVVVMIDPSATSTATLDLVVSGDVDIMGTIDVSGGAGTASAPDLTALTRGRAGTGGFTGTPTSALAGPACTYVAGAGGEVGVGAFSTLGTCLSGSTTGCLSSPFVFAAPFTRAGGGGVFTGLRAYGAAGGGVAGGGAGLLAPIPTAGMTQGQVDCTGVRGGGGTALGLGGSAGVDGYDGQDGQDGQTQCAGTGGIPAGFVGGGGGGSIGAAAAADLAVATTFGPGSGGGGGSADHAFRPGAGGTSGGGGGGGALRIVSTTRINVTGSLLANGGNGGAAYVGTGSTMGCNPPPGAAGGGGSGGVIFLRAPQITTAVTARLSAIGGVGRLQSPHATGGRSGGGGLGRIRLSVPTAGCALGGAFAPPLATGCTPSAVAGSTFVAAYPD